MQETAEQTNARVLSAYQVWRNNDIYWIKTYKTLLRYISTDYKDIFKPIVKGKNTGKRYYVTTDKIQEFVNRFEKNELSD